MDVLKGRDDASYGLPNLQDRPMLSLQRFTGDRRVPCAFFTGLEQIQNTYFGKADMMDEVLWSPLHHTLPSLAPWRGNSAAHEDGLQPLSQLHRQ